MKNKYYYNTPMGRLVIEENGRAVTGIAIAEQDTHEDTNVQETTLIRTAYQQLMEYFKGEREIFEIPLELEGTPFQRKVWEALLTIPYGETRTYKEIASQIGSPQACRAVGGANNRNRIMIVVPCHRVIGKNGTLVGYAGGVDKKELLLDIEKRMR